MKRFHDIQHTRLVPWPTSLIWALALCACASSDPDHPTVPATPTPAPTSAPANTPIGLHAGVGDQSRARNVLTTDHLKNTEGHFGVFAVLTGNDNFTSDSNLDDKWYLYNHEFGSYDVSGSEVVWHGTPVVYWPLGGEKLTFFCYAPYDTDLEQVIVANKNTGNISIDYRPDDSKVHNQLDFCMAKPLKDQMWSPSLQLGVTFEHCLTYVRFFARVERKDSTKYDIYIDEVKLNHVVSHRNITFDDEDSYKWNSNIPMEYTDYTLSRGGDGDQLLNKPLYTINDEVKTDPTKGVYKSLQNYGGYLFLIPQTPKAMTLDVTISYVTKTIGADTGGSVMRTATLSCDIPEDKIWNAGHVIEYYITYKDSSISTLSLESEDAGKMDIYKWENPEMETESETIHIE